MNDLLFTVGGCLINFNHAGIDTKNSKGLRALVVKDLALSVRDQILVI
jgi:hypothetical protein